MNIGLKDLKKEKKYFYHLQAVGAVVFRDLCKAEKKTKEWKLLPCPKRLHRCQM